MTTRTTDVPDPALRAPALRYLSCLRLGEILVLQGTPLLGASFALQPPLAAHVVPLTLLVAANLCLVAHVFALNDWANLRADRADPAKTARVFTVNGVARGEMGRLAIGLLAAALLVASLLGPTVLGLASGIALCSALYSLPWFDWKGKPILSSAAHLCGGTLHFLLGYAVGQPLDRRGAAIAAFFALIFAAGHLVQEIRDHRGDAGNAIRTNAVTFGRRRTFGASLGLFTLAHAVLLALAFVGLIPRVLSALVLFYPIHLRWSLATLADGFTDASVCRLRRRYRVLYAGFGAVMVATVAATSPQPHDRVRVGDTFRTLTRDSVWTEVARIPLPFPTFHPQGMVRVGDSLFVSSVEITTPTRRYPTPRDGYDRDTGHGVGHLFKVDLRAGREGTLLAKTTLGEGATYHPGGIDFDGTAIWVPVAEYRPNSRSLVYAVDPQTLAATLALRVDDHIGGLVRDVEAKVLHGVSWGSRRFYRWPMTAAGAVDPAAAKAPAVRPNPSHYVDYQDCKFAGRHAMLCGGISELRGAGASAPVRLGGLDLVDLDDGRPLHQIPVPLWTASGHVMTRNPVWLEPRDTGLRAYFMPEDDRSTLYVYEVR
jgi:4-hydroxybenzoate polyprenyltransferase